jgi:hypothetical protein
MKSFNDFMLKPYESKDAIWFWPMAIILGPLVVIFLLANSMFWASCYQDFKKEQNQSED